MYLQNNSGDIELKHTFRNRLFIKLSIIFTGFMVISSVIFFGQVYNTLRSDATRNLIDITHRTAGEIDNLISNMDNLALNISTNIQIRDSFTAACTTDLDNAKLSDQVIDVLTSAMIPKSVSKFRISLYNQNGNFISTGLAYNQNIASKLLNSSDYLSWYNAKGILRQNGELLEVTNDFWSASATSTITLYRNIYHISLPDRSAGIVEIQCPIYYTAEFMSSGIESYYYTLFDQMAKKYIPQIIPIMLRAPIPFSPR